MNRSKASLVAILFFLACISQGPRCDEPYMMLGQKCCLDKNGDKICDSDQVICEPPYIPVGKECCLDGDSNGICDVDEKKPAKTTSTSKQIQTTTLMQTTSLLETTSTTAAEQEPECATVYDCEKTTDVSCDGKGRVVYVHVTPISCSQGRCVFKSSKEISAYPCMSGQVCEPSVGCVDVDRITTTTSTIKYRYDYDNIVDRVKDRHDSATTTTTTLKVPCFDMDMGRDYNERSMNSTGIYWLNDSLVSAYEYCIDDKSLFEYYCESGMLKSRVESCPSLCIDGRCCKTESRICASDAECCSGNCAAIGLTHTCISD